jgi:VanZ family protein
MVKKEFQASLRRERFFRYAPLILWIGVIMLLSSRQAAMSQTSIFVRPILEFLFPHAAEETLILYHSYVRKLAHFVEYAVLAFWAMRAFSGSSVKILHKYRYVCSFLLVALIAAVDETNQSFTSSRTGSIYDVLLDASGGLAVISIFLFYKFLFQNRRRL